MRRWVFNALAVVSLLLCGATVVVWVRSYPFGELSGQGNTYEWWISRGQIFWYYFGNVWASGTIDNDWRYLGFFYRTAGVTVALLPLWFVASLFGAPFVLRCYSLHRSCKRRQRSLCICCGYNLRATPDRCPECGTVPTAK